MREDGGSPSVSLEKKKRSGTCLRRDVYMKANNSSSNGTSGKCRSYRRGSVVCTQEKRSSSKPYQNTDDYVVVNETSGKPASCISNRDDVGLVLHWGSKKRPRRSKVDELAWISQKRRIKAVYPAGGASMEAQNLGKRAEQRQLNLALSMETMHPKTGLRGRCSGGRGIVGDVCGGLHAYTSKKQRIITSGHVQSPASSSPIHNGCDEASAVEVEVEWPKIVRCLSRMEKEEDFLFIKGTKLPLRPKRRPKAVEKTLLYCAPGLWLSDLSRGRYDVREKKCVKKKLRGLKAMESLGSGSYTDDG